MSSPVASTPTKRANGAVDEVADPHNSLTPLALVSCLCSPACTMQGTPKKLKRNINTLFSNVSSLPHVHPRPRRRRHCAHRPLAWHASRICNHMHTACRALAHAASRHHGHVHVPRMLASHLDNCRRGVSRTRSSRRTTRTPASTLHDRTLPCPSLHLATSLSRLASLLGRPGV
jgi:hypothetical protein